MNIETTKDNVKITKSVGNYVIDFGTLRKNQEAIAELRVTGVSSLSTSSTCGCTVSTPVKIESGYSLSIEYRDTKKVKPFAKTVLYKAEEGGTKIQGNIKIKGRVND